MQCSEPAESVDVFLQNHRAGVARPVILLADGSRLGRETLAGGLKLCGFVIREISSAAEVEEVATMVMPDVVLIDVRFPDGEGAEAVRELKRNPVTATIPVIVLGSPALGKCREDCLEAGAVAILSKPVCVDEVSAAVRTHLRKSDRAKVSY